MKKILSILLFLVTSSFAFAQTQQGYVKTIGRPGKPGQPLNQVQVRIKGDVNPLLTNDKGEFSFVIKSVPGSNTYIISSVRKQGYIIADNDLLSRPNPISPSVPTVVVMVSQADLEADKRAIENKTRQAVQNKYDLRINELKRQLKEATISEERYKTELAALMDWYDNLDNLVERMAEYYARVDYDHLTAEDAEINLCIEQGQLDRADSLIDARGKIVDRIQTAKAQIEHGKKLQESGANIEQDGLVQLHSAQQDAEHKYNIAMARFDNATALEMLKQLVQSDTLSTEYQLRIGDFYRKIVIDYEQAEKYYKKAYSIAIANNDTLELVGCLNNQGLLMNDMGRNKESYDLLQQALLLRQAYSDEFSLGLASICNNIICINLDNKNYLEAKHLANELLNRIDNSKLEDDPGMIQIHHTLNYHIATCYVIEEDYDKAETIMLNNLQYCSDKHNEYSNLAFSTYNTLGWIYERKKQFEKAIEMYNEAIKISKKMYGENHLKTALAYSNLSSTYKTINDQDNAWKYIMKGLEIRRALLGNIHPEVALSLHNIGVFYINSTLN